MKDTPNVVKTLRAEEARLIERLAAIRATLAIYAVPEMVEDALHGAPTRKAAKPRRVRVEKKPRKKRAEITEAVRSEIIRLKQLPESERPSIPEIAKRFGIAPTSVQRVWKVYRAQQAQPVAASA